MIDNAIKNIEGVTTEVVIPPIANHNPSLKIAWDDDKIKLTGKELGLKLRQGDPSIETIDWEEEKSIRLTVFMLKSGQEKIVATRVKETLSLA